MPFIPAENTARVIMGYTQAGQQLANQFYAQFTAQPDKDDLSALATAILEWWEDFVKPITATAASLVRIECTDMTEEDSYQVIYTAGLPQSGNMSGSSLPNNVTVVTKLATGFTGRSRRGRQYFIGLTDEQLADANHISLGTVVALQTVYAGLIDALATAGWTLVIASFYSGGVPRLTALLTEVNTASVNSTLDSQRRRLPERGI